jgi:hypothetical protein
VDECNIPRITVARRQNFPPAVPAKYVQTGIRNLPTDRQLIALMRAEPRYLAEHPEVVPAIIGGEITITEITKNSVATRTVERFEDYEQDAPRGRGGSRADRARR